MTILGRLNGPRTSATFNTVSWSFTKARKVELGVNEYPRSIGSKNNINLKSPTSWNSPDALGASGSYSIPNLVVSRNQTAKIQAIVDVVGISDPSCTASSTVNW